MSQPPRPTLPPAVLEAWRRGDKIGAIKLLRQSTQLGIAEAKTILDAMQRANAEVGEGRPPPAPHGTPHGPHRPVPHPVYRSRPGLSPGQVPSRSGGGIGWMLLLVVGMVAVWYALQ
jgi:hypothetical protein